MVSKWIKKIKRAIRPNPLDLICKKALKDEKKNVLIAWNRGLGDIPLLLYGMVDRIKEFIPDAHITFITRKNLKEGFYLLDNVDVIIAEDWERRKPYDVKKTLLSMDIDPKKFDVTIENPDPTYWIGWQVGKVMPKLTWKEQWNDLWTSYPQLSKGECYVGVQAATETGYNEFRDWPYSYWDELFSYLEKKNRKAILFGFEKKPHFPHSNLIDLRGETSPIQLLSIIKNFCHIVVLPDSGILALTYYLNEHFPIDIFSLWADPTLGVLKQNVDSPNDHLLHVPLIAEKKDLRLIKPQMLIDQLPLD